MTQQHPVNCFKRLREGQLDDKEIDIDVLMRSSAWRS
jgi:ATP-dependent protease HslVU (ClpYQ) ATPase subunit